MTQQHAFNPPTCLRVLICAYVHVHACACACICVSVSVSVRQCVCLFVCACMRCAPQARKESDDMRVEESKTRAREQQALLVANTVQVCM